MNPPPRLDAPFAFCLCQPGSERWLKAEIEQLRPDLRPSFQRPGLISWKCTKTPFRADEAPAAIFARMWAASLGPARDVETVLRLAGEVGATRLFVCARDQAPPMDLPPAMEAAAEADAARIEAALRATGRFVAGAPVKGDLVLDVVTSPDEPMMVGFHTHHHNRHANPGGRFVYDVPEDLPSRAWRKMVEGLAWSRAPIQKGELVLEIGAAPGGGTRALVEHGLRVLAVDPQDMHPDVLALPGVEWLDRTVGELRPEELPSDISWIASDAHIPPSHVLAAVRRLLRTVAPRGLLLTLKLPDEAAVESLPRLLAQLGELGFTTILARQLPANRRDVFVYAGRKAKR